MSQLITEHLATWTTAPKGIKKLRELILELAVRGLLVPQDPNDEPASALLKKIAAEKARLVSEGKIKPPKPLANISEEEKPFGLPMGWEWERLGNLGEWGSGSTPKRGNSALYGGDIPWFKSGELVGDFISESEETITKQALNDCSLRLNKVGDVLLAMYGATIGKTSILKIDATTNQAVCGCTPFNGLYNLYLLTVLKGYKPRFINMGTGGAQPNISREKIVTTVVPLPPLAEQQRIVAKVDELMQLCDRLEEKQNGSQAMHRQLVNCLLSTLTEDTDAQVFQAAWSQIAANFDCLFTTEHSIEQLKQTILQLAVMGKLVPQNPTDEPASELLNKIATEKARLITEGKIKKQNPLPKISEDEKPFALPNGWEWVRLQNILDVRDGTHDSPKSATGENTYPLVTSKDFDKGIIKFDSAKRISAQDHDEISKRSYVEQFDILFSMIGGNIGNQVMVKEDNPFSIKNVALFKYYNKELTPPFYIKKITEHLALDLQTKAAGGAQPFVGLGFLRNIVIALPPVNEQHRIVTKVDELLTLCEQLKTKLATAQTLQQQLAETLVQQAVA
jgi:type I restriction enzyme S subunit